MSGEPSPVWAAPLIVGVVLAVGAYIVAVVQAAVVSVVAGWRLRGSVVIGPFRSAGMLMVQQRLSTERPDEVTRVLAPAAYAGLAAVGLAIVPLSEAFVVADVEAGIVLWGTLESLAIVAIFLHGWSPNSHQPLLAGYRFMAAGLSYLLLSMFVLIAAALPAESLAIGAIVDAQHGLWNVVRQPLGLPLFAVVALGSTFWGPLNLADGTDLSGGTSAEESGVQRLVWEVARAAMLVSFAAMGAAVFLGGWWGPWLPGAVWMAVKTVALIVVLVATGQLLARVRPERFVTLCWTMLLPLGFVDLAIAGVEALP